MTSKWIQSAPPASTACTSSPKRAKSADKIEGEIITAIVSPSPHAARRAYPLIGFLDALSFLLRHLRHRLRQAVGHQFIRVMPAHLAAIGLGYFLIADSGVHFELRIAFCQGAGPTAHLSGAHRSLHARELEAGQSQALGNPRQYN